MPPTLPIFSSTMTVEPFWLACTAAAKPAPPAPTITTSASSTTSAPFSTTASFFSLQAAASRPALVTASRVAAMMASLVKVAEETASTLALCISTMRAGICSTAGSLIPGVSPFLVTSTLVTTPFSSTVTATSMEPAPPILLSPTPVNTPASATARLLMVSSMAMANTRERTFFIPITSSVHSD